ncbi:MAG: hypothetical protein HYV26_16445 [Candidatus Hydrogenedentes bacterium]|nr:hypothetical protein [Candidatus Hydrogenedentota bacterium]MBI3117219.1 hypothetical protein [Candidatus Hydrogenedentota bacterium]
MGPFEFVLILVVIIMLFIYKMAKLGVQRSSKEFADDDVSFMQNLNSSLVRMERRIEALETILMDRLDRPPSIPREHAET